MGFGTGAYGTSAFGTGSSGLVPCTLASATTLPDDGGDIVVLRGPWEYLGVTTFTVKITDETGAQVTCRSAKFGEGTYIKPMLDGERLRFVMPPMTIGTYSVYVYYGDSGLIVCDNSILVVYRHHAREAWNTRNMFPSRWTAAGPRALAMEPLLPVANEWPHPTLQVFTRAMAEECQLFSGKAVTRLTADANPEMAVQQWTSIEVTAMPAFLDLEHVENSHIYSVNTSYPVNMTTLPQVAAALAVVLKDGGFTVDYVPGATTLFVANYQAFTFTDVSAPYAVTTIDLVQAAIPVDGVHVETTLGFPDVGSFYIEDRLFHYTGKTSTLFTGITPDRVYDGVGFPKGATVTASPDAWIPTE